MIVHSAGRHLAQRDQIHFEGVLAGFAFCIARIETRQEIERDRARKFWRSSEAAFLVIETPRKLLVGGLKKLVVDLSSGSRLRVLRLAKRLHDLRPLLGNFFVVLSPSGCDPFQNFPKTRLTVSIFRRKICSADKRLQIGREPDTHRPTTAAS